MRNELKTLCALPGPSGYEDAVRTYIMGQARPFADEMRVDAAGNLIVTRRGARPAPNQLMICAHMDEVGVIIHKICDDGYLKFDFLGSVDRRVVVGKRLRIGPSGIPGVVGVKAYHMVTKEEEKKFPQTRDLYIDIGARDQASALALVTPGDFAVFDSDPVEYGNGMLKAKAIDDRMGCAVMLALLREDLPMDVTFAFTAQEEIGMRGAFGAAFAVMPQIALVLESTTAADLPGNPGHKRVCAPGQGPVIPFMDREAIYDRELFLRMRSLAEANGIPWQTKHYLSGGTDAGAVQRTKTGVRTIALSAAIRYLHAPAGVGSMVDFENILRLTRLFIADLARH